jgi:hypothetical protein
MNWKVELGALVEETMAFAQSVKSRVAVVKPDVPLALVEEALAERSLPVARPLPERLAPMVWPESGRAEVKRRVANFKAHQELMQRERADYATRTMGKALRLSKGIPLES